jgi:uncharacterized protein
MPKTIVLPVVVLLALFMTGCGGIPVANKVANSTAMGQYDEAIGLLEKNKQQYSGSNNMLYYFERGTLLQRTGDYKTSVQELGQAEALIEELYGTSVTQGVASFLTNDMALDYVGEDFEQIMVNVIKGLDFMYMQKMDGALVEARKVNTRLTKLSGKYSGKAIYNQDAFARYIAAFIHEADREYNDAYIDYKLAYKGFEWYHEQFGMPIPYVIKEDLLRLSRWMGFDDQYRKWRKKFGKEIPDLGRRPKKRAEVMLVVYDGIIPAKETYYVSAPITDPSGDPYILKVAFPMFVARDNVVSKVRVGLPDGTVRESEVVEPLDAIAIQNLKQRIGLITVKAIARATTKYIAAYQARKVAKGNLLVALATNIFTYVTEKADTRSWRTLPSRFHIVRVPLPPGKHDLEIRIETMSGTTRPGSSIQVELKKGQKKVIPVYVPR